MSDNTEARIQLAEFVGLKPDKLGGMLIFRREDGGIRTHFDPFTNANDDYAVLEWMRGKCGVEPDYAFAQDEDTWQEFREGLCEPEAYQIGDYARAALKVLDDD